MKLQSATGTLICPASSNAYFYEPRGVAVVIAPWNFPLAILCGMAAAAVATGNTVILKPAEQSSVVGREVDGGASSKPGSPPGVVNFLPGVGEEIGPVLTEPPGCGPHLPSLVRSSRGARH